MPSQSLNVRRRVEQTSRRPSAEYKKQGSYDIGTRNVSSPQALKTRHVFKGPSSGGYAVPLSLSGNSLQVDWKREIGLRLKAQRELKNLTVEKVSRALGGVLSKSRIGNYEQGTRLLKPGEAVLLAKVLECSPAYLMCLEDDMTPQEQKLVRDFSALPEKDRNEYARRIEAIALLYREPVADERLQGWKAPRIPKPKGKAVKKR